MINEGTESVNQRTLKDIMEVLHTKGNSEDLQPRPDRFDPVQLSSEAQPTDVSSYNLLEDLRARGIQVTDKLATGVNSLVDRIPALPPLKLSNRARSLITLGTIALMVAGSARSASASTPPAGESSNPLSGTHGETFAPQNHGQDSGSFGQTVQRMEVVRAPVGAAEKVHILDETETSDFANKGESEESRAGRFFEVTRKTVSGRFLDLYDKFGGIDQLGWPIGDLMEEKSDDNGQTYTVQYFERAVFEYHPENAPPNDVLLTRLGAQQQDENKKNGVPAPVPLAEQDKARYDAFRALGQTEKSKQGELFPETGKIVPSIFLDYWLSHGGLAQQGLPLSDVYEKRSKLDGKLYLVQEFERAEFEYHPENVGTAYEVLLAQLGSMKFDKKFITIINPETKLAELWTRAPETPPGPVGGGDDEGGGNDDEGFGPEDDSIHSVNQGGIEVRSVINNEVDTTPALVFNHELDESHKLVIKRLLPADLTEAELSVEGFDYSPVDHPPDGWSPWGFSSAPPNPGEPRGPSMTAIFRVETTPDGKRIVHWKYRDPEITEAIFADPKLNIIYSTYIYQTYMRALPGTTNELMSIDDFQNAIGKASPNDAEYDEAGKENLHNFGFNVQGYEGKFMNNPWETFVKALQRIQE